MAQDNTHTKPIVAGVGLYCPHPVDGMPAGSIAFGATECGNPNCDDKCRSLTIIVNFEEFSCSLRIPMESVDQMISDQVEIVARQRRDEAICGENAKWTN